MTLFRFGPQQSSLSNENDHCFRQMSEIRSRLKMLAVCSGRATVYESFRLAFWYRTSESLGTPKRTHAFGTSRLQRPRGHYPFLPEPQES